MFGRQCVSSVRHCCRRLLSKTGVLQKGTGGAAGRWQIRAAGQMRTKTSSYSAKIEGPCVAKSVRVLSSSPSDWRVRGLIVAGVAAGCGMIVVMADADYPAKEPGPPSSDDVDVRGSLTKKFYFYQGKPNTASEGGLDDLVIFGGSIFPELADDICGLLGAKPGKILLTTYADGECAIMLKESVLGKDVFIISPTNTNTALMETLLIASAAKRASAERITAVIPFYGYSRQDRRFRREPIAAADVARMFESMGVDRIMTVDLHSGQIQGFFAPSTPVDHIMPTGVAAAYFAEIIKAEYEETLAGHSSSDSYHNHGHGHLRLPNKIVVVAPQEGQVARAQHFQDCLSAHLEEGWPVSLAFISRAGSSTEEAKSLKDAANKYLVGDVQDAFAIIVDDLVDTGNTLERAVGILKAGGATRVAAFATHSRFSKGGEERVLGIKDLEYLVTSNTLPHRVPLEESETEAAETSSGLKSKKTGKLISRPEGGKIRELSLAPLLAEVIYRSHKRIPFEELLMSSRRQKQIVRSNTAFRRFGLEPRRLTEEHPDNPTFTVNNKPYGDGDNHHDDEDEQDEDDDGDDDDEDYDDMDRDKELSQ